MLTPRPAHPKIWGVGTPIPQDGRLWSYATANNNLRI